MGKAVGNIFKGASNVVKAVVQPVYNATLKQIPGVDKALVGLDKAVGKSIPGGWGTVAAVASSFIPGSQLALMGMTKTGLATGLGALSGSGVMRKGNEFNLQGAIMGGAMAYGASQLSQGLMDAGSNTTSKAIEEAASKNLTSAATGPGDVFSGLAGSGSPAPEVTSDLFRAAQSNIDPSVLNDMSREAVANAPVLNTPMPPPPSGLASFAQAGKDTLSNMADAGRGIKNLAGFGADGSAAAARAALTGATSPITQTGVTAGLTGTAGMMALDEQQRALDSQLASGSLGQAEYNAAKAKIDEQVAYANSVVGANPLQSGTDLGSIEANQRDFALTRKDDNVNEDFYLAEGGAVDSPDDQLGIANGTPMRNFERGGIYGLAAGGMLPPRFLSGGGDGMSDSIKANIHGRQEARLADGEFVIPADVVSHLGNGSSKAGAKQLYSMMDKVRQARVGTKKQGKQINPRKYLAA